MLTRLIGERLLQAGHMHSYPACRHSVLIQDASLQQSLAHPYLYIKRDAACCAQPSQYLHSRLIITP